VASAVIVPEEPETNVQPNKTKSAQSTVAKRRHSEASEPESTKRVRLSPQAELPLGRDNDGDSRTEREVASPRDVLGDSAERRANRRQAGQDEERKRGQRMFGALLGALSAGSTTRTGAGVQKRRADIEKRAQAKLKQLDQSERRKERDEVERIRRRRRRDQWVLEEQVVSTLHQPRPLPWPIGEAALCMVHCFGTCWTEPQRETCRWRHVKVKERTGLTYDEMNTHHDNLVATARFLQTTTEPRLVSSRLSQPWHF